MTAHSMPILGAVLLPSSYSETDMGMVPMISRRVEETEYLVKKNGYKMFPHALYLKMYEYCIWKASCQVGIIFFKVLFLVWKSSQMGALGQL